MPQVQPLKKKKKDSLLKTQSILKVDGFPPQNILSEKLGFLKVNLMDMECFCGPSEILFYIKNQACEIK